MKCLAEGQYFGLIMMKGCQLDGILIGLSTRVAKKETIVIVTRESAQLISQLLLQAILYRVGVETQLTHLLADLFHIVRMGMADRDDSMAAIEVEILGASSIIHIVSLTTNGLYGIEWIYIEEIHTN